MFSAEKPERKTSTERLKYVSAAQLLLGVALFVCAIVAVVKQEEDEYYTYYIGGFTCGITGAVAGIVGLYTSSKASSYSGDDVSSLQKQLQCTACIQMILGYVVFMVAISGIMMNILFLASNNDSGYYDEDEDDQSKIHVTLSACILAGIFLLLIATFLSFRFMGTCCRYQGYNQRMTQTYPTTVGTTQYYQGQTTYSQGQTAHGHSTVPPPVFSTGGFNQSSNPPPYPVSQSYGIGSQQPPAYGFEGMGQQQPPAYGFEGMGQQQQPPAYGFQQTNTPTAPPPAYPY